jgi:GNAT superfamily N-acetyltransferase
VSIAYRDDQKNLPVEALIRLFEAVGWSDGDTPDAMKPGFLRPWLCSTLVVSAWDGDRLVGAVRVLSDTIFRSVIYDLLVDPPYQGQGIGTELGGVDTTAQRAPSARFATLDCVASPRNILDIPSGKRLAKLSNQTKSAHFG